MKHLFLFLLLLLPVLLSAQDPLPANPRKLRLGYQTDGEGIVLYGSGVPSYTPTRYRSAFHYMDTTNNIYYQYNRIEAKWDTILAGAGAVADGVSVDNSTWSKIGGTDVQQALTKTDSVLNNITIDGSQIQNKFEATTTTLTVSADSMVEKQRYVVNVRNSTVQSTKVQLPQVQSTLIGRQVIVADSSLTGAATFVTVDTSGGTPLRLKVGDQYADKYYLDRGEVAVFSYTDSTVTIQPSSFRRAFSTPSEVLQARFLENDEFRYKAGRYKVQKSALSGATVDSVFVIPVNEKAPYGENLIPNSEFLLPGVATQGRWLANSSNINVSRSTGPTALLNVGADSRAYWAWSKTSTTTQNMLSRIDFNDQDLKFQVGEKVTASFYIRVNPNGLSNGAGIASTALTGASASGPALVADTTNYGWTRYEHTFDIVTPTATFPTFTITYSFPDAPNDTVYIDRIQLERGPSASPYKKTESTDPGVWAFAGETSYAMLQPDGEFIDLAGISRAKYETDSELINAALDYCELLDDCKGVQLFSGQTITSPVYIPENYTVTGGAGLVDIVLDLNDSTKAAFILENTDATSYAANHSINNLRVSATSRGFALVDAGVSSDTKISGIRFSDASQLDYGIKIGSNSGIGAINTFIDDATINEARLASVYYENAGNNHFIRSSSFYRSGRAIYATRVASLELYDCGIENNDSTAIEVYEGNEVNINSTYFESNGEGESGASFIFENLKIFTFNSSRVSSGSKFLFKPGCNLAEFTNNDLFQFRVEKQEHSTRIKVNDNNFNDSGLATLKAQAEQDPFITEEGNIGYNNANFGGTMSLISRRDLSESRLRRGMISNSTISDTITLDDVFLTALSENLITYSDSIGPDGTVDNVTFQNNAYPSPTGDSTAALVIGGVGATNERRTTAKIISPIAAGEVVTFSFFVKDVSSTPDSNDEAIDLIFKDGGGSQIIGERVNISQVPSEWVRQYWTVDSMPGVATRLEIDYEKIDEADSLAVCCLQLNVGPIPRKYVATTSAIVQDSSITIPSSGPVRIDSLDNRAFDGGELYILPTDPDTLDFSAAGGLFDQIQDMTIGTLDNFTSSGDTLYYTGSVTRPFTVNFTATLEADTGSQELQMRIKKNTASLDKCTVSQDYSTSGVEVQLTGTCRVDLATDDNIILEVSPTQNTSQLLVRRANINLH